MLSDETKIALLKLRFLVIRAAQKDSLKWWEDDSLTQAGDYLVERLFLMDVSESARGLALEAGQTRYRIAFGETKDRLHLFRLDPNGQVDFELSEMRLTEIEIPRDPITSQDELRAHLLDLTGKQASYEIAGSPDPNGCLEIRVGKPVNKISVLELAEIFAWACLESPMDKPFFPYIRWKS
jgi:hypothetical protein